MKDRRLPLYIALAVMLALMPVGTMHVLWPHFLWQSEPLHSAVEAVGALVAIVTAIVLLQRQPDEGGRRLFWVAMGLLGAGILDVFHAASQPGQGFVLLHSAAVLVSGFGFALVWLPELDRYTFVKKLVPWAVIIGSTLFGIWVLSSRGTLPAMVQDGEFTTTAKVLNLLSGVFFIIAAGRFLIDFHRSSKSEPYLFSGMSLLFGLASLTFTYSALWDDTWWFWHLVRLAVYLLVMGFVIHGYRQTTLSLKAEITERKQAEERVAHLTAVLRALRDVNQLITREKDRESLIQKSCDLLVQKRGYERAWILLLDENINCITAVGIGLDENTSAFLKQLETGNYPVCVRELLGQEPAFIAYDQPGKRHEGCVLANEHSRQGVFRCKLEHEGKLYGILGVALPSGAVSDQEEQGLFLELCGDIAFALANIEREEKRRQVEERYRSLVDNALVGVFRSNLKGDILYVNDALVKMLGFDSAEEMIAGGAVVRYENPSDRAVLIKELTEKGKVNSFELEVLTKTGEIKNVILNAVLEGDTLSGMLLDITERKRAEETLRQSEEKLRTIFNSLALGVVVTDRNGKILQVNEAKVRMHGYDSKEELIGRSFLETIAEKDHARAMDNRRRRLEHGYFGDAEYTFLRKDGGEFPGEVSNAVLSDASGNEIGLISIIEDITERKRAETKLEQSAREWQTTFDSISDWVSVHDKDFKILRVNRAFADFLKMKPEEIIGRHCYELIHGENEASQYCSHKAALETGKPAYREFYNPHLGIYMEVVCAPIFDERGEITTTVHIGRDITERKRMQEQLMITDRLASIGELASGIAHELNNPLTGVIGFSELLLERDVPDDVKKDLMVINREAQRAARVVRNLLTFARKHPQEKQAVNINNTIQLVLELRAYEQKLNNIEVNTHLAADLPEVMADSFQLQQVFLNIIINAEYFMFETHKRGGLTIATERVGDIVRASLADDGPGIAQENLEHIFDPFFTTKEVGKGTGLGLSICHGIITKHNGRIYAESELGKGATFVIELPISQ